MPVPAESYFTEENSARDYLEAKRWPEGPVCTHCGATGPRKLKQSGASKTHARKDVYQCNACRRQFAVTLGTLLEDSHTPLHKWLLAIYLVCSSEEGKSVAQLRRDLGLRAYRTAWFLCHRIRWALQRPPLSGLMKKCAGGPFTVASTRRPLRVPLPWDDVVRGLLEVKLERRDRVKGDRTPGAKMQRR